MAQRKHRAGGSETLESTPTYVTVFVDGDIVDDFLRPLNVLQGTQRLFVVHVRRADGSDHHSLRVPT